MNIKLRKLKEEKGLKKLINNPKRLEKEIFVRTDPNGENVNPSGQQNYPGPSRQKS